METNETVFKVNDLNLSYGTKNVLKNINMEIYKNQVTALIGPSGCGKSSFLRCFNRMNDLISKDNITGEMLYGDTNIKDMKPVDLRIQVGMVFQNPNPFPMSIFDNVAYGPRCNGVKRHDLLEN